MNNIYKVIWSKAKNCYVVASEIARSHTKSASGSEKIGGVTRRSLLASLMALSLLCGGLGVASATLEVVNQKGTDGTVTIYTQDEVDKALEAKGAATDVETNKAAIADLKNAVGVAGKDVADQKAAIAVNTKSIDTNQAAIKSLQDDKLDKALATSTFAAKTELDAKANTDLSNLTADGEKKIKNTMSADMNLKADKAAVTALENTVGNDSRGLVKDVNDLKNQGNTLNTALGNKADQSALDAAKAKITTNETNINALQTKTAKLSPDGTKLTGMTAVGGATVSGTKVNAGALKVTGEISDGTVNTTLAKIDASMKQTETNKGDIADLKKKTNTQQTWIGRLNDRTTNITHDATGTSVDGVTFNAGAVTGVKSINGIDIGDTQVDMNGKKLTDVGTINGIDIGDTQVDMNGKNLTNVGTINGIDIGDTQVDMNGKNLTGVGTINGIDLGTVDTQVKTNADAIAQEKTDRENAIGNLTEDKNYIKKDKNVSDNLVELDKQAKTNADAIAQEKTDRENAIGSLTEDKNYIKKDKNVSDNLVELDKQAKTNADAITETNQRTAGITRDDTKKETSIEGRVTVDTNGNIKAEGTITSNGLDARAGEIKTTGKVSAGDVSTGTLETTGNAKIGGDLTVDGKLNVGEIYMKNDTHESTGKTHDSATAITADGISNRAKVTDENGNTTESKFTHNEKGTFNYAKDEKITGEWKGATSNVTADGVSNKMTDSAGNTHTYYQTAAETKEQLVNGNKSNFEKKTAEGNTISIKDKDADGNKKSLTNKQTVDGEKTSVTNKDSSSTVNQGADQIRNYVASTDGTKSSTEVKADGITNTSDGTITNDANHIENKANTMDTTVTGKATESYGELETTVNGNETHTVTGNQTNKIDKDQENIIGGNKTTTVTGNVKEDYKKDLTTTVGGNELHKVTGTKTENVTGKVTENYKAGQATNVTGDQDINVSGTQTTTATDIKRNASSGMIDTIDNDYGTNTETKVAGKTTTDVSIKGTGEKGKYIRGANESRDYLIKGTLKNSETKTVDATSTEITDGKGKTSATIQDVNNLAGSVTNGTETGVSGIHANDNSVSIDSIVTDGNKYSVINQKKGSIQSTVVDGTNSTVILQDKDNVTIASSNGTVAIGGKDIVNNASENITNTAKNITNAATETLTDKVGDNTRVTTSTSITDTVGTTTNRKIEDGKITDTAGDSTVTTEKAKGTTFAKTGSKAYSTKEGAPTDTNIAGNHITTGRVDANELGVSDKDDQGNTADFSVEAGEGKGVKASASNGTTTGSLDVTGDKVESSVKDGDNETSIKQTATDITNTAKDGTIKNDAKDIMNEASKSITNKVGDNTSETMKDGEITTSIKDGAKKNTVISTADGTSFFNSEAWEPVTGASGVGTAKNTTIKGNTITTGKVTMDYAEVMKDLGVGGNAKIDGKTTTGSLEVTGTSTLKGDVTMESNATVKKDLTVGGNATIAGDVTARSYKVDGKTYINADGINANDQKITNVADGSISVGSKDAVNGGQLYGVKRDLEHQVDKVGANAAAMANLRPMEFDPSSKWNIAAAIGNYGSETAAAIGAFYRPNDNVMVNLSTAFGTGENMVGGGVSVRLGKGGNKLSREETNALKAQVADLTARMDALLSVLNPNMSKDFPDVPENHWAYEAVSRLAGNDIVQGYPDGEFHGERTMTRYEMAEIIYNALSRGAEAERKLVEEFKPELQAMAASEKSTAEKAEG